IKGALIYPAIVITAMIGIGILMLIYVVPTLAQTFEQLHTELPITTQFIIAASNFLTSHTLTALGGAILIVVVVISAAGTSVGKRAGDWLLLRIPLIKGL